ncbi:hypothetical protein HDV00_004957 [Rhizophlyctis rosea]|nr:hypothetical protein HDV00_004957 [Rhizophlyctis rosea]
MTIQRTRIPASLITAAESFAKLHVKNNDASHNIHKDWSHIHRVRNLTLRIAKEEQKRLELNRAAGNASPEIDFGILEVSALLHDVEDFKVTGQSSFCDSHNNKFNSQINIATAPISTVEESQRTTIETFLKEQSCPQDIFQRILAIVSSISYRKELAEGPKEDVTSEAAIVKDADKLDAIGALGIARCFAYSGARGRPLHDPSEAPLLNMTKAQYDAQSKAGGGTAINHFYEKLFKLKDTLRTTSAREIAEERTAYMREFVERFVKEWDGEM